MWHQVFHMNITLQTGNGLLLNTSASTSIIKDAVTYIDKNYSKDISLKELSDICGISRQHFCRVFKKEFGMRQLEYLAKKRISEAKAMLCNTGKSISLISLSLMAGCAACSGQKKENKAKDTYSITSGPKEQPDAEKQPERTVPVDTKEYGITIDGGNIRTENKNGLTYKGFSIFSGNSSSDLLMDYKAQNPEAYAQLMQYLFGGEYPLMNHVKLEMGKDRQRYL